MILLLYLPPVGLGGLEGCGLRGAVGRGLRAGGRIRGSGGGIVTGSGRLVAGLGDPVGPCQRFMGYFRDAEKHGILKNFARRALGHADLGGSATDHIVEIAAIHDAAGNIHTGIVERARGTANGALQHLQLELAVQVINPGNQRFPLHFDLLEKLGLFCRLGFGGKGGLEFELILGDLVILLLKAVESVDTKLGLGDLLVDIVFLPDHVDNTLPGILVETFEMFVIHVLEDTDQASVCRIQPNLAHLGDFAIGELTPDILPAGLAAGIDDADHHLRLFRFLLRGIAAEIEKPAGIGVPGRQHCGGQQRRGGKTQFLHRYPQLQLKILFR